jgi:hypothetical protein
VPEKAVESKAAAAVGRRLTAADNKLPITVQTSQELSAAFVLNRAGIMKEIQNEPSFIQNELTRLSKS